MLCIQKHLVQAPYHHTHTFTLALTGMQRHKLAHQYTHMHTNTHTHKELCLPAGFASLRGGNTSFNQTGQLRTNFSFVVTAWGPKGSQSLYWQSTAHWIFVQKLLNNLVWILIRTPSYTSVPSSLSQGIFSWLQSGTSIHLQHLLLLHFLLETRESEQIINQQGFIILSSMAAI